MTASEPTSDADSPAETPAVVVAVRRGSCEVQAADGPPFSCELSADIATVQRTAITVGDRVRLQQRGDAPPLVTEVLPRHSLLSRPDPMDPRIERAIVANIDDVVIIVAARRPTFKPRLIDRYLVAIQRGGARPVVVLNKVDLLKPRQREELLEVLAPYAEIEVPVFLVSAESGEGIEALRAALSGRTCAFVGHSGVGKSSLLNALMGDAAAETGLVRDGDGKGRHTTTFSALHRLPDGTCVVDTPGIRAFGLWGLTREELRHSFPEFDGLSCRYGDCLHAAEPEADCAVKQAVRDGRIHRVRFDTYLRLLESLQD